METPRRSNRIFQRYFLFVVILNITIIVLLSPLAIVVRAETPTVVTVTPARQTVPAGSGFNVSVVCVPARPVKAFDLKITFNPTYLQADNVSEGDFFQGYQTFFNNGTIDNQAGTIINIYDLIVGPGNVTSNGTLVNISFTAKSYSGTSAVTLTTVHVTNETEYLLVTMSSASVTVTGGSAPPSPPPPSPPPSGPPVAPPNLAPIVPEKPAGPSFVQIGATYTYMCFGYDPEGGRVKLRMDWGDGVLSNWSEFVASNVSVSFSYSWQNVSSFNVRAMAQDEEGVNSNWSESLMVVVSQAVAGNQSPTAVFVPPSRIIANQSVVFNASGCFSPGGVIVSYVWDFGDGTHDSGMYPTHVYSAPGQYLVTLIVTDDQGLTSTVSQYVTVSSAEAPSAPPTPQPSLPSWVPLLALVGVLGALVVFMVVFREPLRTFISRRAPLPTPESGRSIKESVDEIKELLDALYLDMKEHALPLNKESLLDAYCDLILEHVSNDERARLPELSLAEVERIVDETFYHRVVEKVDRL